MKETLGKYRIKGELGKGGFATVYLAENTMLGTSVALKVLNPTLASDERFIRRFQEEARHAAALTHPNIVRIIDFEEDNGRFFITMDYVDGTDLQKQMQKGLLPLEQVVDIAQKIGAALDYAHSKQLIHRDVKPSNILLGDDGAVKLTDFGIVRAAEGTRLTTSGAMIGTAVYMSPEQTRGIELDGRSDLYSLGVMLYEMVTGQVPFTGETPVTVGYKHVQEPPPAPSSLNPRAGGAIEAVLLRALAKERGERYQTGEELGAGLETAVNELHDNTLNALYEKACALQAERQFETALQEMQKLEAMKPDYQDAAQRIAQIEASQQRQWVYDAMDEQWQTVYAQATEILAAEPDFPDEKKLLQRIIKPQPQKPQIIEKVVEKEVVVVQTRWDWTNMLRVSGLMLLTAAIFFGYWLADFQALSTNAGFADISTSGLTAVKYGFVRDYIVATVAFMCIYAILLIVPYMIKRTFVWLPVVRILWIITVGVWMSTLSANLGVSTGPWAIFIGLACLLVAESVQLFWNSED